MVANPKDFPQPFHSLEEYFAIEAAGEVRYEYWDGQFLCMSGGTRQHGDISVNAILILGPQLVGRNCRAFNADQAIKTPALPPYRYPDAGAVCGERVFERIHTVDALVNPTLIIEVLSAHTEVLDRGPKREAYQALPSLKEYLLMSQNAPSVTQYLRQRNEWLRSDYGGLDARIELPSIECTLALSELYEGVEFS